MQNLSLNNIDKQIKSLNTKRKQFLSLSVKIKDEELNYKKELDKLRKKHEKKMSILIKKQDELKDFFAKLSERFPNSSPCGGELANEYPLNSKGCS